MCCRSYIMVLSSIVSETILVGFGLSHELDSPIYSNSLLAFQFDHKIVYNEDA